MIDDEGEGAGISGTTAAGEWLRVTACEVAPVAVSTYRAVSVTNGSEVPKYEDICGLDVRWHRTVPVCSRIEYNTESRRGKEKRRIMIKRRARIGVSGATTAGEWVKSGNVRGCAGDSVEIQSGICSSSSELPNYVDIRGHGARWHPL